MAEEERQFGTYKIFQAFHIGNREVVMAEDIHAAEDEMYLCAFVEDNGIIQRLVDAGRREVMHDGPESRE